MKTQLILCAALVAACQPPVVAPSDAGATHLVPDDRFLPTPTGACPTLTPGRRTFNPAGGARNVILYVSDQARELHGPLVFFWHGAGGDPDEVSSVLGPALLDIMAAGGVVAAPYHDDAAGSLPWFLSGGGSDDTDLKVADEILGCVHRDLGIDLRHIHSIGFSAGAMHNTQFVAFRSGYVASIVNYSGARLSEPDEQDPANRYPVMLFHGGPTDEVLLDFETETNSYAAALRDSHHFTFICNHGQGHTVPLDGRTAAWRFLQDHPFGAQPEPYASALPEGFPAYCSL